MATGSMVAMATALRVCSGLKEMARGERVGARVRVQAVKGGS